MSASPFQHTPEHSPQRSPQRSLKRSNKPIFWSLFGAGGMLSALIGPMLILLTGIAAPLGWLGADALSYQRVLALAQNGFGKLAIFVVVMLFLFHGLHRFYHTLHDFGIHIGPGLKALAHGLAAAGSVAAAYWLIVIG